MVKTLYLMRHGQTIFNARLKLQGWVDSPLTARGIEQAKVARDFYAEREINFAKAYSSTSERASDTLEIVTSMPYTRKKELKEWHFGSLEAEGTYLLPPSPYGEFFVDFGGESEADFRARAAETLLEVMQETEAGNTLVVAHGALCNQFMLAWQHTSKVTRNGILDNCGIMKFEFDNNKFKLLEIINHNYDHLA